MLFSARFVVVAAVLATLVASSGCPEQQELPPPPPPEQECELDLNVDTTGAQLVDPGTLVEAVLCPAFDQDYFAFDVDDAGTIVSITLSMATTITNVEPAYRIVKEDGSASGAPTAFSAQDPDTNRPTRFTAAHRIEEPGRYYVIVFERSGADDGFDIVNPYTLDIELAADPDTNEPNNDDATATIVPGDGGAVTGQIGTTGDEDWYAVDVAAGAKILDVTIEANPDSSVAHTLAIVAADGVAEVAAGVVDDDETIAGVLSRRLRSRVVGGARAYVVVKAVGDAADLADTGRYELTIAVLDNPDANEGAGGNDTVETATRVNSGTQLTARLASTADQDTYRIAPGTFSPTSPGVLIVEVDVPGAVDPLVFRPQVTVLGEDVEADSTACVAGCAACDQNVCKIARLQRFVRGPGFRTAYPLRSNREVIVIVNEFGDDAFTADDYTIRFEVIADPDPGERGDDFLIPNLEFAGFANGADLRRQFNESTPRARVLSTSYPAVCTGGVDDGDDCLPLVDVPEPIAGIPEPLTHTVDCSVAGAGAQTVTATGRLSYEGDRDYFAVDVPDEGYWALDFRKTASGVASTPVELAMFVHTSKVIANTLEADETLSSCIDTTDCPTGSICVDGACWAERTDNPTFSNQVFPRGDECAFVSVDDRGNRPLIIEVTDNGINDFDPDLTYTFQLTIRCGCPDSCEVGGGLTTRCQGVPPPG